MGPQIFGLLLNIAFRFWKDIESSFGSLAAFFVRRCFRCLLVPGLIGYATPCSACQLQPQASYLGMVLCTVTLWRLPNMEAAALGNHAVTEAGWL